MSKEPRRIFSALPDGGGAIEQTVDGDALHWLRLEPTPAAAYPSEDLLSAPDFLEVARRERLRADRTRDPLSIAVFEIEEAGHTAELIQLLDERKRETDFLGLIDANMCAVLFPNTDETGVASFERAVREQAGFALTATCATYPAELFKKLTSETGVISSRMAQFDEFGPREAAGYRSKRALDVVGALGALALFGPLMVVVALIVRLTSVGPVIFRQNRIGTGGRTFELYKFRSMATNSDDSTHRRFVESLIAGTVSAEAGFKIKTDPRVTWIGKVIRKTSIDELPQLFNVLKGDMSLVGPRPPVPYEAQNYKSWHLRRVLEVKPGMTGLWQVEGRSRVTFDEMVRMDIRYIRRCSLAYDLQILLRTVKVVFLCEGAL